MLDPLPRPSVVAVKVVNVVDRSREPSRKREKARRRLDLRAGGSTMELLVESIATSAGGPGMSAWAAGGKAGNGATLAARLAASWPNEKELKDQSHLIPLCKKGGGKPKKDGRLHSPCLTFP